MVHIEPQGALLCHLLNTTRVKVTKILLLYSLHLQSISKLPKKHLHKPTDVSQMSLCIPALSTTSRPSAAVLTCKTHYFTRLLPEEIVDTDYSIFLT